MPAPTLTQSRSLAQRLRALEKANDVRSQRNQLKRDLRRHWARIDDVLADPPGYLATMKVMDLILTVPKWGRVSTLKALNACEISPAKTVGALTRRQRDELVSVLRARS